jgi:GxxExxY protein
LELSAREIPFQAQCVLRIRYKEQLLQKEYIADLICYAQILVEIKTMKQLMLREEAQLLNQMKATGFRVGLLVSFGDPGGLEWQRMVR